MKKTVLALFVFALCGISLPSCGNDDPDIEIPYLTLGQSVLYFSAEGGTQYNTLVTNVESSQINVSSDKEWVSVDYTPSKIYCNVSENHSESRQAMVFVSIKNHPNVKASFTINQEGISPYLTLEQSELSFSVEGGTQYINLLTNVESSQINVSSDKEWVSVDYISSKIYCNVSENPGASRQATVSVSIKNYPGVNASLIIQQEGNHSVGRYEVTYSLQVTQDLIDLLDAQCHYRDEKGELQSFIVGAPNLGEKIVFTIFPTEFGFDLMAKNKKPDVVLTKDSYSFGFIAKIDVKIYSKSGELLHDLPGYCYMAETTQCSKANVDKLLDKYVNGDLVFFASFTQVDAEGKIVESDK